MASLALTPEEIRKIYEEEKARIEVREQIERERDKVPGTTTIGLSPNVAGLLCYVVGWVSGIIFLILEQKNKWVHFHAAQSIIVFGVLNLALGILGWIPIIGHWFFSPVIWIISIILWIILMVKAYNGERFKVVWAGDVAERWVGLAGIDSDYKIPPESTGKEEARPAATEDLDKRLKKVEDRFHDRREGRITASAFAIAWSVVLLIFFNFFYQYLAYYHPITIGTVVTWIREPFFTNEIRFWLPILDTTLMISIAGNTVMIILDRRGLRQLVYIIIDAFSLATVITLLVLFPFNFNMLPSTAVSTGVQVGVTVILVCISVGIGIGIAVRVIKFVVNLVRRD